MSRQKHSRVSSTVKPGQSKIPDPPKSSNYKGYLEKIMLTVSFFISAWLSVIEMSNYGRMWILDDDRQLSALDETHTDSHSLKLFSNNIKLVILPNLFVHNAKFFADIVMMLGVLVNIHPLLMIVAFMVHLLYLIHKVSMYIVSIAELRNHLRLNDYFNYLIDIGVWSLLEVYFNVLIFKYVKASLLSHIQSAYEKNFPTSLSTNRRPLEFILRARRLLTLSRRNARRHAKFRKNRSTLKFKLHTNPSLLTGWQAAWKDGGGECFQSATSLADVCGHLEKAGRKSELYQSSSTEVSMEYGLGGDSSEDTYSDCTLRQRCPPICESKS